MNRFHYPVSGLKGISVCVPAAVVFSIFSACLNISLSEEEQKARANVEEITQSRAQYRSGETAPPDLEAASGEFRRENRNEIDPLEFNLIQNPNGLQGSEGWRIIRERGDGFYHKGKFFQNFTEGEYFGTSYNWSVKRQVIDLEKLEYSLEQLDREKPVIYASEEFSRTYCGDDRYYLTVKLLDESKQVLAEKSTGNQKLPGPCDWNDDWVRQELIFADYPEGLRYIVFKNAGKSKEQESGYYGTRMRNAKLLIQFPEAAPVPYAGAVISDALQAKLEEMGSSESLKVSILCQQPLIEEETPAFSARFEVRDGDMTNVRLASSDAVSVAAMRVAPSLEEQLETMDRSFEAHSDLFRESVEAGYANDMALLEQQSGIDIMSRADLINPTVGLVEVELSKAEIEQLAQHDTLVSSIDVIGEAVNDLDSAYRDMRLYNAQHLEGDAYRQTGSGVGVYMNESGNTCFSKVTLSFAQKISGIGASSGVVIREDRYTSDHANKVAQSIRAAAPSANLYCSDERFRLPSQFRSSIHIVNYSFSYTPINTNRWFSEDTSLERHVWTDRVAVFKSAGNDCPEDGCQVTSPGKAHNAITVGAYNDANDTMYSSSRRDDPETGAIKPEIVAPGVSLRFPNSAGISQWPYDSGTSYSSPLAAGMAASVVSRWTLLKKQPQLIKAAMLALAAKNIVSGTDVDGLGAVQWNEDGYYEYWSNYSNSFLVTGGWKLLREYYISRTDKEVRVVISWLNDIGKCDNSQAKLCMDIDLKVHGPDGSYVDHDYRSSHDGSYAPSNRTNNNWRMVQFWPQRVGNYKIYVWRRSNWYTETKNRRYYSQVNLGLRIAYLDYK